MSIDTIPIILMLLFVGFIVAIIVGFIGEQVRKWWRWW